MYIQNVTLTRNPAQCVTPHIPSLVLTQERLMRSRKTKYNGNTQPSFASNFVLLRKKTTDTLIF